MSKPLAIDLYCGLGGWTEGLLAEGYEVVGFDIERHQYGDHQYPAQLVLQDVLTIHGSQFKDAAVIVASSPCQAYSYMAMPWSRAKQIARALRGEDEFPEKYEGYRTIAALNALFEAPKRIQREACEAAGRFIPMIQENVRGAIPWVGRSQWNFGSYHLWGDVPALMPMTLARSVMKNGVAHRANGETNFHHSAERAMEGLKNPGFRFDGSGKSFQTASVDGVKVGGIKLSEVGFNVQACRNLKADNAASGMKVGMNPNFYKQSGGKVTSPHFTNPREDKVFDEAVKGVGIGSASWQDGESRHPNDPRNFYSKSSGRKAASAAIAKIPFPLASHIARVYYPRADQ